MNCLLFEFPNDERTKDIENILGKWRQSYYKVYFHSFVLSYRVKFILFNYPDNLIPELLKNVNFTYNEDDCVRQLEFKLTKEQLNFLINMSLK